jgi:hypothetical protein
VAYSIEPFDFKSVQSHLLPPQPERRRDRLGKQPGLFNELADAQANEFK